MGQLKTSVLPTGASTSALPIQLTGITWLDYYRDKHGRPPPLGTTGGWTPTALTAITNSSQTVKSSAGRPGTVPATIPTMRHGRICNSLTPRARASALTFVLFHSRRTSPEVISLQWWDWNFPIPSRARQLRHLADQRRLEHRSTVHSDITDMRFVILFLVLNRPRVGTSRACFGSWRWPRPMRLPQVIAEPVMSLAERNYGSACVLTLRQHVATPGKCLQFYRRR